MTPVAVEISVSNLELTRHTLYYLSLGSGFGDFKELPKHIESLMQTLAISYECSTKSSRVSELQRT